MPNRYLSVPYVDGGRTSAGCDCWGLTRLARHELYGLPMLGSYGHLTLSCRSIDDRIDRDYGMQDAAVDCVSRLEKCNPRKGAIVLAYRGRMCRHTAVVVEVQGALRIMSIHPDSGVYIQPISAFADKWTRLEFYSEAA